MWFLPLLTPIIPHLRMSPQKATFLVGLWVGAQAVWLGAAYQLEFVAKEVYLCLWVAGIQLFGFSIWVLGEIIEGFDPVSLERKEV